MAKTKSPSPPNIAKPNARKRRSGINISEANIRGVLKEYLKAPVSAWINPKKLIDAIHIYNMFQTTPVQALNNIRSSLENIGRFKSVPSQLSKYANNCHQYSTKSKFSKEFQKLYVAKQGKT